MSVSVGTKIKSGGVTLLFAAGIVFAMTQSKGSTPPQNDVVNTEQRKQPKTKTKPSKDNVHLVKFLAHWTPQGRSVDVSWTVGAHGTKFRHSYSPYENKKNARSGEHIDLLVEATKSGGSVQCLIYVDGKLAKMERRTNDAGDCYVSYIVP